MATRKLVWAKVKIAYLEDLASVGPDDPTAPLKLFEAHREHIERVASARYASGTNPPLITEDDL